MSGKSRHKETELGLDRFLGKDSPKIGQYDPELLVPIPRSVNRDLNGISDVVDTFFGVDVWTIYEVSFLLESGLPVVGVAQFSVPADSRCIVESKSVKLYFSSLNSEKLGVSKEEAIHHFKSKVAQDISCKTEAEVSVRWVEDWDNPSWKNEYTVLEEIPEISDSIEKSPAMGRRGRANKLANAVDWQWREQRRR